MSFGGMDMRTRDHAQDESLGLNCAWYADVLPAFSHDGRTMIWTGQRGNGEKSSQLWVATFDLDAAKARDPFSAAGARDGAGTAPARP